MSSVCCGIYSTKIVLHVFQFVLLLTGFAICGLGVWNYLQTYHFLNILDGSTYSTTIYLMEATGCLVILVFFVGCCSISKYRTKLLFCYILFLVLIFLMEALVGVLSYIYKENIEEQMKLEFNTTLLTTYKSIDEKTSSIDYMQQKLHCCGAANFSDWKHSEWLRNESIPNKVPDSCCKTMSFECGIRDHPSNIFQNGCMEAMTQKIKLSFWLICAVSLGFSFVQIFGIVFGIILFLKLESGEYDSNYKPNGSESLLRVVDSNTNYQ